jgi:hypothetical protein
MRGISWLFEDLLASEEEICSIEFGILITNRWPVVVTYELDTEGLSFASSSVLTFRLSTSRLSDEF